MFQNNPNNFSNQRAPQRPSIVKNFSNKKNFLKNFVAGGVRRNIWIFVIFCLILIFPFYLIGMFLGNTISGVVYDKSDIVSQKNIEIADYEIGETEVVSLNNGEKDLYVRVSNSLNKEVGFFPWVYTYQVLNKQGEVLDQGENSDYLLPGEVKYVIIRTDSEEASEVRLTDNQDTTPVFFNQESGNIAEPKIVIASNDFEETEDGDSLLLKINIRNDDILTIKEIDVTYIIRDTRQSVVGIGKTKVRNLKPDESRDLNIKHPKPENRTPNYLEPRWSINYLDENAVFL